MKKKIVIAGGTGFIGTYLARRYSSSGYDVIVIARSGGQVSWSNPAGMAAALENASLLVNLAGKSVDCRYNEKNKREILESRTGTTEALGRAILSCVHPPKLWINAGTATIYRHAEDRPMTESTGETGSGFSVDVAKSWERSFFSIQLPATRQVFLRIAIVLGKDGGVMKPFENLVRFGLGGKQGKGTQMFSWIHIEDLASVIAFIETHPEMQGVFNCSAPDPVTNGVFMKTLSGIMKARIMLPSPIWLLRIGAVFIRTETELILKSRWVLPEKLLTAGFSFRYPSLKDALKEIIPSDEPVSLKNA